MHHGAPLISLLRPAPRRAGQAAFPPSSGTLSSLRKKCCVPGSWEVGASGSSPCSPPRTHLPCPGSLLAPWSVVRHGPNITAVMKGCCQGHLQRELLMPPVHPKTALTAPPRCTMFVVAMHRASTKDHAKRVTQTCRACVVVVEWLY